MNDPIPEEDLKALFARQQAVDHARAPSFHAMRTRALAARVTILPARPATWHWALSGAAACGLALVAVLSLRHSTKAPVLAQDALAREFDELDATLQKSLAAQSELTAWQPPTDFLLHPNHNENTP